jgi:hypothetical protein
MTMRTISLLYALGVGAFESASAAMLCEGRYDTVPWFSDTQPTISHNIITSGGDLYAYNAWAADGQLTYYTLALGRGGARAGTACGLDMGLLLR